MTGDYFILEGGQKLGPFTADELMDRPLEPADQVLSPMNTEWIPAHSLPEFTEYFKSEGIFYPTKENTSLYILRLPAYIIDCLLVFVPMILFTAVLFPKFFYSIQPDLGTGNLTSQQIMQRFTDNAIKHQTEFLIIQLVMFLVIVFYNAICESGSLGASVGKYVLGLTVVDELGYNLTFKQALQRNGGKLLYEVLSFLLGPFAYVAYLRVIWGDLHQAIHDRFSGCYVVSKNK